MSRKLSALYEDDDDDTTVDIYPVPATVKFINNDGKKLFTECEEVDDEENEPKTAPTPTATLEEIPTTTATLEAILNELQRNTKAVEDLHSSVMVCYREVADLRFEFEDERKLKRLDSMKVTPENIKRSRVEKTKNRVLLGQLTLTQMQSAMEDNRKKGDLEDRHV